MRTSRRPASAGPLATLLALARGQARGRSLRLRLKTPRRAGARPLEIELLALGFRWGDWLAAAQAPGGGELRLLPLGQIEAARLQRRGVRPVPPGHFDPLDFALADLHEPAAGPPRRAVVRLAPPLASVAGALLPGGRIRRSRRGVTVEVTATSAVALQALLRSLGPKARLVEPLDWAGPAGRRSPPLEPPGRVD